MNRSVKSTILIVLALGCAALLFWVFFSRRNSQVVLVDKKVADINRSTPEELDLEIRSDLPIGSPLFTVDNYLKKRGIEFSFGTSKKTLYATARKLEGGTMVSGKSLALRFHFDDAAKLESVDTKVTYTGP